MSETIRDGGGRGYHAKVTGANQLKTVSESHTLQHHVSRNTGEAYQIIGDFASVSGAGPFTVLHIKNGNNIKKVCVSYIRVEAVGITASTLLPDPDSYFSIGFGRTYASGGTAVTPVVMNRDSGKSSTVTCYDNNPTLAGTFEEFDRWYPDGNGKMMSFNKEGSVILGQNDTLEIRYHSDAAASAGTVYARVTFFLLDFSED